MDCLGFFSSRMVPMVWIVKNAVTAIMLMDVITLLVTVAVWLDGRVRPNYNVPCVINWVWSRQHRTQMPNFIWCWIKLIHMCTLCTPLLKLLFYYQNILNCISFTTTVKRIFLFQSSLGFAGNGQINQKYPVSQVWTFETVFEFLVPCFVLSVPLLVWSVSVSFHFLSSVSLCFVLLSPQSVTFPCLFIPCPIVKFMFLSLSLTVCMSVSFCLILISSLSYQNKELVWTDS